MLPTNLIEELRCRDGDVVLVGATRFGRNQLKEFVERHADLALGNEPTRAGLRIELVRSHHVRRGSACDAAL